MELNKTFYLISPLKASMDFDYTQCDFEYLPNGGRGGDTALHLTVWETFSPKPNWKMDNIF